MIRHNGHRVNPIAPVIGLDIDGTLARYHDHFVAFAEQYLQERLKVIWHQDFRGEFNQALGLDKALYRQIKLAYRQGGMKRSIPTYGDIRGLVQEIRESGIQVWICTTRPWNRLDNIDPDTTFWVERNMGRVDGVIYGEEKYEDLLDIVGKGRVLGVVDDLPENIQRAQALGIPCGLRRGSHNEWWRKTGDTPLFNDTREIQEWTRKIIAGRAS